jgi:hypothetical protein
MSNQDGPQASAEAATYSEKSQLETLAFVPLTDEQTGQIRQDLGIEVSFLLVQRVGRTLAREIDPGLISLTRLTWCW